MSALMFSEEYHPELLEVPLKGRYLKELVESIKDNVEYARQHYATSKDPALGDMVRNTLEVQARVVEQITRGLDSEGGLSYGIDAGDLKAIIRKVTNLNAMDIDKEQALQASFQVGYQARQKEIGPDKAGTMLDESGVALIAQSLMETFSQCLAVQEGKEKEYVRLADEQTRNLLPQVYRAKETLDSEEDKKQFVFAMAAHVAMALPIYDRMRERKSLISGLNDKIMFGEEYARTGKIGGRMAEMREAIALVYDLDTDKAADRERLRRIETDAFKTVEKELNISVPKGFELQ